MKGQHRVPPLYQRVVCGNRRYSGNGWYAREGAASIQKKILIEVNCNVDAAYTNGSQHAEQNGKSSKNAIKK